MHEPETHYRRMRSDDMPQGFLCCCVSGILVAVLAGVASAVRIVPLASVGVASSLGYISDGVLTSGLHMMKHAPLPALGPRA